MTRKLDRLNGSNDKGLAFQALWQRNCETVEANVDDLQTQIDNITTLLQAKADAENTNLLTPVEKKGWVKTYADILAEQSDIDAKATTYGITTEKTNYDTAITALTTYLGTLTSPVAWNVLTGNTTIVRTTFNTKFGDAETTKQLLLNKMHGSAKTLADGAQGTANTATTNAATAQTTANTVKRDDAITSSYTAPGNVLTGSDAGSNATITIANHNRIYGDIANVAVTGASITALAYSTAYYVYYDQTSRAGGAVTFHADTDVNEALPTAAAGRHFVGKVTTPAALGGSTSGGTSPPSGGGDITGGEVGPRL